MKQLIISLILFCLASYSAEAFTHNYRNETLQYRVMYKWGLINKQAGTAYLTIKENGDRYEAQLIAHSQPWADKFYCVRDTLNGIILKDGLKPLFYEKISHEGSEDKHDTVKFSYEGNSVVGHTTRKAVKKGEVKRDDSMVLMAEGATVDMLSSFYVMRSLPFEKWKTGHKETLTIFSGKSKETLTFQYHGIERVQIDEKHYQCYHITFIFTSKDGKKSSDDMDAWITTGNTRTPVLLEGKLPVGKVKCEIIN